MSEHAGPPAGQAETLAATVRRKQAGLLTLLGVLGVAAVMPFAFALQGDKLAENMRRTGASMFSLALVSCAQSTVFAMSWTVVHRIDPAIVREYHCEDIALQAQNIWQTKMMRTQLNPADFFPSGQDPTAPENLAALEDVRREMVGVFHGWPS